MNITILNSSGRVHGNTERLLKALEDHLAMVAKQRQIDLEIKYIALAAQDIKICRGCRSCFDKGSCPLKDDAAAITESILASDALILSSPVAMEDVNGIMKNWIDRMAFCAHRPVFYGKCATVISTSGAGSSNHTLNTMKNALTAWGFQVLCAHKFKMGAYMESEKIEESFAEPLSIIAANLINAVEKSTAQKPTLFSLISFKIQQKYYSSCDRAGAIDRDYWAQKGWLSSSANYYMPVKCNFLKLSAARMIGAILSKRFF